VTYRNPWCFEKCHYQVAINYRCQGGVKGSATTTFAIHSICDDRCHSLGDSKSRLEGVGENVWCDIAENDGIMQFGRKDEQSKMVDCKTQKL